MGSKEPGPAPFLEKVEAAAVRQADVEDHDAVGRLRQASRAAAQADQTRRVVLFDQGIFDEFAQEALVFDDQDFQASSGGLRPSAPGGAEQQGEDSRDGRKSGRRIGATATEKYREPTESRLGARGDPDGNTE